MTRPFDDSSYKSPDGLDLYARRYEGDPCRPLLLCMHGLTRNSADFHAMLETLPDWPALSVDQRGRGRSAYDSAIENYRPDVYCQDMMTLLQQVDAQNVIAIGTSMGGLMTMMMSAMSPGVFKAAIINDIGPEIDPAGLQRLRGYVGKSGIFESWDAAAASIKSQGPEIYPEFQDEDWIAFAERTCVEMPDGKVKFAYDPAIQDGMKDDNPTTVPPDLWPLYESLFSTPLLIIRGDRSDILSQDTAERMADLHPDSRLLIVPNRGHAPLLDEPVAVEAITTFLEDQI